MTLRPPTCPLRSTPLTGYRGRYSGILVESLLKALSYGALQHSRPRPHHAWQRRSTPQSSTTSLPTFDNHARRLCTRKSTFHLHIQINKTSAVHSPGIDALGFKFTNAQLTPALGAAKHPKVRTPMTPELGQFHFQPKSSHFDTGGYVRLVVKRALIFPILQQLCSETP